MFRDPFVIGIPPGRLHLALRTLAANDNAPLESIAAPANAAAPRPILRRRRTCKFFAKLAAFPAPSRGLGVEAGKSRGARP